MKQFVLLILFCLSFQLCWCQFELLTCVEAEAKLPVPLVYHSTFYDGKDSIYIFGGYNDSSEVNSIYKYDIIEDSITLVANFPIGIRNGMVTVGPNGTIYYIGGMSDADSMDTIFGLEPETNTLTLVGHLDFPMTDGVAMKYNESSSTVQILPGYSSTLECLDLANNFSSCGQTSLINQNNYGVRAFVADGFAYIFPQAPPYPQIHHIEKLDLSTLKSELGSRVFIELAWPPSVVFDGTYGYIIGGYTEADTGIPTNGIIRYDIDSFRYYFRPVTDFPTSSGGFGYYTYGSAQYVEKLDRIYMFGGLTFSLRNEIWYIDLSPPTVPTA